MAETVHLFLKANGTDIQGQSSQISLGRENSIECVHFVTSVKTARETGSGMASGRRQHEPIIIQKRIDKSSPLIAQALCENHVIEGVFKFFRPNPSGDGTTEQFYTISISKGRVSGQKQWVPETLNPASTNAPPLEEVSFVFGNIIWTFEPDGVTHQDAWDTQR